MGKGKVVSFGS